MDNDLRKRSIYVFADWYGDSPFLVGSLHTDHIRGKETYAFEYSDLWLSSPLAIPIDPFLPLCRGWQYSSDGKIFGAFSDSCPDRWGRFLLSRKANFLHEPPLVFETDFLLSVSDATRSGGFRFSLSPDGPFLALPDSFSVPPFSSLRTLEEISRKVEDGFPSLDDRWLLQLVAPGSSLGGARPKASVLGMDGNLYIAKFPSKNDLIDVGAWEWVMQSLASRLHLDCEPVALSRFSERGSTFLCRRFDRLGDRRIHFMSAMTALGSHDGEGGSYLNLADFIRSYSSSPSEDLKELWQRIVFSVLVSNRDDHLRNHGFLLHHGNQWRLSPLFDVNPSPGSEFLSLSVDGNDSSMSLELVSSVSEYFQVEPLEAESIIDSMSYSVSREWRRLAVKAGIPRAEIESMKGAFARAEDRALNHGFH